MPRAKVAKSHQKEAERAGVHYLVEECGCDPNQIVSAVKTSQKIKGGYISHRQDLFASDVMGKTPDGYNYYAQVTTGQVEAVRQRRRKLEKIPWNPYERVMVLQMVSAPDIANARKTNFYFRIHRYYHEADSPYWEVTSEVCYIPRGWFKKLRSE